MIVASFIANPPYADYPEGVGTWVLTDTDTGRRQHMAIWPPMTRAEFLGRARHHIRTLLAPLPAAQPRSTLRLAPSRRDDDDAHWY